MRHETFHYPTVQALKEEIDTLGVFMPLKEELSVLFTPQQVGSRTAANRIAFEPMEGTDGTADGAPGELTRRRYLRFAEAGPGLTAQQDPRRGRCASRRLQGGRRCAERAWSSPRARRARTRRARSGRPAS